MQSGSSNWKWLKALAIELGEELREELDTGPSTDIDGNSKKGWVCLPGSVPFSKV